LKTFLRPFLFPFVLLLSAVLMAGGQQKSDPDPIFTVGGDVKPPKIIHYVEPDPTDQDSYVEGIVRISTVIGRDGVPSDLRVVKGLNEAEDKLAVEALKQWRFSPGTKDGQPVRVRINVEINFHLL
jgi:TonB family protein